MFRAMAFFSTFSIDEAETVTATSTSTCVVLSYKYSSTSQFHKQCNYWLLIVSLGNTVLRKLLAMENFDELPFNI